MPRKGDHIAKAEHDERFAASFDVNTTPYIDWVITALFYAALHYVEAYLATKRQHSPDHRTRDNTILRDASLERIYNDYNELKNFSINARYYMQPFTASDVTENLLPRLNNLKAHVASIL